MQNRSQKNAHACVHFSKCSRTLINEIPWSFLPPWGSCAHRRLPLRTLLTPWTWPPPYEKNILLLLRTSRIVLLSRIIFLLFSNQIYSLFVPSRGSLQTKLNCCRLSKRKLFYIIQIFLPDAPTVQVQQFPCSLRWLNITVLGCEWSCTQDST